MAFLKINSVDVTKYLDKFEWQLDDMSSENSGEDLTGYTHKDIVRRKRHLNLSWLTCPFSYAHTVIAAASESAVFNVEFADPLVGGFIIREMYVGTRSSPAQHYDKIKDSITVSGISFNLIETGGDRP